MKLYFNYNPDPLRKLYDHMQLPEFINFTQHSDNHTIVDLKQEVRNQLIKFDSCIKPNMSVAVAVGSRGIDSLDIVTKEVIGYLKDKEACPYIVAAMGSHGGATSEGQELVLAKAGITKDTMGVEILTSMEVEDLSSAGDTIPAFVSCDALKADKIILINRIKAHTDFSGSHESGLMKLIAIGLGKHKGALTCHSRGWNEMSENIEKIAGKLLDTGKVIGGIGIIENEKHQACLIEAIPASEIHARETELLKYSKSTMGRLPFKKLDALIVLKCGKDVSGSGMDTNVIGRKPDQQEQKCEIDFVVCSDLTDRTYGNAIGIGNADIICERIVSKIDLSATYINGVTSRGLVGAKIPMIVSNDAEAIKLCMLLSDKSAENIKIACIRDTNSVNSMYVSSALLEEAGSVPCLVRHEDEKFLLREGYIEIPKF